jgi:methionyl-tRNA synthetase
MSIYLTTAISYTNGTPHIGHLYEIIVADFIKKQYQLISDDVKLLTGTDEHGKKIEETAKNNNMNTKDFCDMNYKLFLDMNKKFKIDYDYFIRTTDEEHKKIVKEAIIVSIENKDIYLGEYQGYYNIREEKYIPENVAKLTDYKDSITGIKYDYIKEESYFFKLSNHLEIIKNCISTIYPQSYKNQILNMSNQLHDLSISRTSFSWGIDFPNDKNHIVYVWFDALLNYITGLKILYKKEKPDQIIHIIGKDIIWFHSVIYPAILNSCFKDFFPSKILVHGFICDKNGNKMSKSIGNVITPDDLNKYPIEAIRYYMLSAVNIGDDLNFSIEVMIKKFNNVLISNFGNLVQRLGNLSYDCFEEINKIDIKDIEYNLTDIINYITTYDFIKYNEEVFKLITDLNIYISEEKPWEKKNQEKMQMLKLLLYKLNIITKLLYPYIPDKIIEIRKLFGFNKNLKLTDTNISNINIKFKKKQIMFKFLK